MERPAATQRRSVHVPSRQGGCLGWPPPPAPPQSGERLAQITARPPCCRGGTQPPAPRARSWAPPPLTTLPPPRPPLRWRGRRCAADTSIRRRAAGARVSRNPQPRTLISPQPRNPSPQPATPPPPPPSPQPATIPLLLGSSAAPGFPSAAVSPPPPSVGVCLCARHVALPHLRFVGRLVLSLRYCRGRTGSHRHGAGVAAVPTTPT